MKVSVIKNESELLKNTNNDFRLLIGGNTREEKKDISGGTHSEYFYLAEGRLKRDEVKEMHVHDYGDEFIYVTKGKGVISSESECHVVKKGDVAYIPKGSAHKLENLGKKEFHYLFGCAPLAPKAELGHRNIADEAK